MKYTIHVLLLAATLHSCSMLPHSSMPVSISPIEKPVYDSVLRVTVPVHLGIGATAWSGTAFFSPDAHNTLHTRSAGAGVAMSGKWFSAGFSGNYYSGRFTPGFDLTQSYPEFGTQPAFQGYGLRLNVSFDKQLIRVGKYATWRCFSIQSNVSHEQGDYANLRNAVTNDPKNEYEIELLQPSSSSSLAMQYFTSLSYQKKDWHFNTSVGIATFYEIEEGRSPLIALLGRRFVDVSEPRYRDMFISLSGGWKNFILSVSFMNDIGSIGNSPTNRAIYQSTAFASIGYRINLK